MSIRDADQSSDEYYARVVASGQLPDCPFDVHVQTSRATPDDGIPQTPTPEGVDIPPHAILIDSPGEQLYALVCKEYPDGIDPHSILVAIRDQINNALARGREVVLIALPDGVTLQAVRMPATDTNPAEGDNT